MDIKELIERVKLTPEVNPYNGEAIKLKKGLVLEGQLLTRQEIFEAGAEAQLNKVLNDPDLALIKYCECGGKGYEEGGDGAPCWHVECAKCHDTGIIVIPLRDAMKEAQANGH